MSGIYIALLRGINVGRAKRMSMADLRQVFERLKFRNVRTVLNSGNVIYASSQDDLESMSQSIERALAEWTGISARVAVLSRKGLQQAIAKNPLTSRCDDPARLLVAFFVNAFPNKSLSALVRQDWGQEAIATNPHAAYLWCPCGVLDSALVKAFNKLTKDGVTMRNWATMLKIREIAASVEIDS